MLLLFAFISLEATTECKDGKECFEKAWEFYKQKGFKKANEFYQKACYLGYTQSCSILMNFNNLWLNA